MNKLIFVPHVEIAGVIEAETENSVASTVSDALKLRQSTVGDIHDCILHFIFVGFEFYDRRDDEVIQKNIIDGYTSAGVQSRAPQNVDVLAVLDL